MDRTTVRTDLLAVGLRTYGPAGGRPVLALHGFPDAAGAWDEVGALLGREGLRVVAPDLRGFGGTRFLADSTPRTGQLGALVADAVALLDALALDRVAVVGQDWGARVGQALAALYPDRVEALVSLGSYGLSWEDGQGFPPPPVLHALWYQWVLMLDLGPALLHSDPQARDRFFGYLWDAWSPTWPGRRDAFAAVLPQLRGPDVADVVLSAYRHGRAETVTDPRYDDLDAALAAAPGIDVPSVVLLGADDGVEQPDPGDPRDAGHFHRLAGRHLLPGVGHWPHREAPDRVAAALLDLLPLGAAPAPAGSAAGPVAGG